LGEVKGVLVLLFLSYSLFAQVTLLPDKGEFERAIMDPIDAEAIFFDRLAAPYGKNFESWIGGEDFAKEMQSGAGGYKIWSDRGEYLPRGEVFYRWPVESLPDEGFLEIFSDDHVIIEILNEGRHLVAGKGKIVFDLSKTPVFYENFIIRFSSLEPHRALVWANIYSEYEWVQAHTASESDEDWLSVDSTSHMKLRQCKNYRYKRSYHCVDPAKKYVLHFPDDIEELWINGQRFMYPQVLPLGILKEGKNELIYLTKNWRMGSAPASIRFEELKEASKAELQWLKLNGEKWLYESAFYFGEYAESGQNLIFNGSRFDSLLLTTEITCTQDDLDQGVNLLFRAQSTIPNSYWRGQELLLPPFVKVNGFSELTGPHGLSLRNLKLGINTIEMQVSAKMLKPYLAKGAMKHLNLRAPQHAYEFAIQSDELIISVASQGNEICDLYVNNKKVHAQKIDKGAIAHIRILLYGEKSIQIGSPNMKECKLDFQESAPAKALIDLRRLETLPEILSYFLGCDKEDSYKEFNQLRASEKELDLLTLMPDGVPVGVYLYSHFRDQYISACLDGTVIDWAFFEKSKTIDEQDVFEKRAYLDWLELMGKTETLNSKEEFYSARVSYIMELYTDLKNEFEEPVK
jgi:hypothetical protein